MAAVTGNIGFGVTSNATYEAPYSLPAAIDARSPHQGTDRLEYRDRLSRQRRACDGPRSQIEHDDRYDLADEYMEVIYKLLEGSWEDGAVVADRNNRLYADPAKIHAINHVGRRHRSTRSTSASLAAADAGALSGRGIDPRPGLRRETCECLFFATSTKENVRALAKDVRAQAVKNGRRAEDLAIFLSRSFIVGRTRKEAEEKFAEYRAYGSVEGALAHFASSVGIDYAKEDLDAPLRHEHSNSMQSILEALTTRSSEQWTLRKLLGQMGLGSRTMPFVGSAEDVADEMQGWVEETGVDGFNLSRS